MSMSETEKLLDDMMEWIRLERQRESLSGEKRLWLDVECYQLWARYAAVKGFPQE